MTDALAFTASSLAVVVFLVAMVHVTVTDLREMRIRNWVLLSLLATYPAFAFAAGFGFAHILASFGVGLLVFLGGFGVYAGGLIGGGDAKLAAVSALWLGPDLTATYLVLVAAFGGIFCVVAILWRQLRRKERLAKRFLPYGPGMALSAAVLLTQSNWLDAL